MKSDLGPNCLQRSSEDKSYSKKGLFAPGKFFMLFYCLLIFYNFFKTDFEKIQKKTKSMKSDLGPNCLQISSAEDKSYCKKGLSTPGKFFRLFYHLLIFYFFLN